MITIRFYETDRPYGCFSNFSRHAVEIDGVDFPTSEHAFQAAKFTDAADREAVRSAATPFLAARLGRERHRSFRADWEQVRDDVMLRVLRVKFTRHPDLAEVLRSTAGAELVEHTANDSYWADGGDGTGRNMLGKLLEQVRDEPGPPQTRFLAPPWIAHPDVEPSDMFWRMGAGEHLLAQAARFHAGLGPAARAQYDSYFPVPASWRRSW